MLFFEGRIFVDRFYLKIGFILVEFYSENEAQLKALLFSVSAKHFRAPHRAHHLQT